MNLSWMAHNLLELAIAYWFLAHTIYMWCELDSSSNLQGFGVSLIQIWGCSFNFYHLKLQNVGFYDFGEVWELLCIIS